MYKLSGIDDQSAFILIQSIMTPAICENHAAMLSALQPEKARTVIQSEAKLINDFIYNHKLYLL
jgi:hypothetical protein